MPRTGPFLGFAFLFVVAACGSDNPADPGNNGNAGTFQVTVTGALTTSFTANATFTSLAGDVFGLRFLATGSNVQQYVQVNREDGGRPAVGTYTIDDGASGGDFIAIALIQGVGITSNSGTLTITASSPNELQGQVAYEGTVTGAGGRVTITASFRAACPVSTGCT